MSHDLLDDILDDILIIEDDDAIRTSIAGVLEEDGYTVGQAANGREGLDYLLAGNRPRLILLDLMMPVMSGWDFREEQEKHPDLASIPVVVVSAYAPLPFPGVHAVVSKPLRMEKLLSVVREVIGPGQPVSGTQR